MESDVQKIVKAFKAKIVFHPRYRQAFSQIQNAIENTEALGEPVCALLCGPSGTGKSTLCHYFRKIYSGDSVLRRNDGIYVNLPVFYCEVPPSATVKGLITNMLRMLIDETPNGTIEKLTHQLITCLKTCQVKMIFLDEIQRLCITTVSEKVRLDSLQWIVSLLNWSGIPVILSGTELCRDIRREDEAFENRYPYFAELSHFTYETGNRSDFFATLQHLDTSMYEIAALGKGVHLNDPTIAAPLFVGTRGNLKRMRLIINDALKTCLRRDEPRELKVSDFFTACEYIDLPKNLSDGNPYDQSYDNSLKFILDYQETDDE
ncbi:TniB family NTP-binding protein [Pseudomonas kilonensis]|uniref:TniB family NTP-binding protein n=1 Tax=Pseudomonas kilonensis TaxID=132476 RepID=UPI00163E9340|nr:TniB family NTP-binding protein [Pseudomonas kilonensis]